MTGKLTILHQRLMGRVEVNPNSFNADDPNVYVARFRDADRVPALHDVVVAVQPEDDPEPDFVSTGIVVGIDPTRELIELDIDWVGFHDDPSQVSTQAITRPQPSLNDTFSVRGGRFSPYAMQAL
ncbi:hypothetical protein MPY17_24545 [Rhodococcus opacus]|uniref:hypothetical protein n=1 Tax=Rhodococcus opacus TaxID=37919 RepID=UPI001FF4D4A6|nr:hypothetical protein [Rhodococcus opacus]UOT02129.1 hypothetical protein MPY17_24545 [Rhodococcus opacus]